MRLPCTISAPPPLSRSALIDLDIAATSGNGPAAEGPFPTFGSFFKSPANQISCKQVTPFRQSRGVPDVLHRRPLIGSTMWVPPRPALIPKAASVQTLGAFPRELRGIRHRLGLERDQSCWNQTCEPPPFARNQARQRAGQRLTSDIAGRGRSCIAIPATGPLHRFHQAASRFRRQAHEPFPPPRLEANRFTICAGLACTVGVAKDCRRTA